MSLGEILWREKALIDHCPIRFDHYLKRVEKSAIWPCSAIPYDLSLWILPDCSKDENF